jgi:hypothetical protein
MNEHLYNQLVHEGLKCFELPTQNINLLSAFSRKSNRIRKQAMLDVEVGDVEMTQIVLLSPQLLTDVILGLDFLIDSKAVINFARRCMVLEINGEYHNTKFVGDSGPTGESGGRDELQGELPCKSLLLTADGGQRPNDDLATDCAVNVPFQHPNRRVSGNEECDRPPGESIIGPVSRQQTGVREENMEGTSIGDRSWSYDHYENLGATALKWADSIMGGEQTAQREGHKSDTVNVNRAEIQGSLNGPEFHEVGDTDLRSAQYQAGTMRPANDDRDITEEQLRNKLQERNHLSTEQQQRLYEILLKYLPQLTKCPGKCTQFEYEFTVEGSAPVSSNSRPIPFALREQVREHIQIMLRDDILEESFSDYLNPLTLVVRDNSLTIWAEE